MAKQSFDPVDIGLTVVSVMTAFIMVGIAQFDIFNVSFSEVVWSSGSIEVTMAYALSVGSFAGIVATNDNTSFETLKDDAEKLDDYYMYAIFGTIALMAGWLLLPDVVASFFQSEDLWGVVYVGITAAASVAIGWVL